MPSAPSQLIQILQAQTVPSIQQAKASGSAGVSFQPYISARNKFISVIIGRHLNGEDSLEESEVEKIGGTIIGTIVAIQMERKDVGYDKWQNSKKNLKDRKKKEDKLGVSKIPRDKEWEQALFKMGMDVEMGFRVDADVEDGKKSQEKRKRVKKEGYKELLRAQVNS